jgi:hypothetical protein
VVSRKSDKELAFLRDLYVATDWGERFAELVDEYVKLPKKGNILYVAAGTGAHALAVAERAGSRVAREGRGGQVRPGVSTLAVGGAGV